MTDSGNNLVGLVAVGLASRPADPKHPYGHRKFESAAAGVVGLSLLVVAYDVVRGAVERLAGQRTEPPDIGLSAFVVLSVTLAINLGVARYEHRRGRELGSPFLTSDAAHTRSDVLVTAGVMLTAALVRAGYTTADAAAALGISAFIAWTGIAVLRSNFAHLSDSAMLDAERIVRAATRVNQVASAHKVRTRGTPGAIYVDLHIQIAPHLDVTAAHRVTHAVIDSIKQEFPEVVDVLVHTEPAGYYSAPPPG